MAEKSVSTESFATETRQEYTGRKLRVAIIGCGGISETHIKAFQAFPDVELVAGVDVKPQRLKAMEEKYGLKHLYTDWKKMLKDVKPDAVSVCTPNGVHATPAIDAANAGCHVIVEKPMAMNPAECQKMIDASRKNKKKLAVGFQYRYHPNTDYLVRAREDGQFGKVMFVKCQALRRRGIPNWGVFGQKKLQGGGPMIDIGVHVIEMAHYLMGSPEPDRGGGEYVDLHGRQKIRRGFPVAQLGLQDLYRGGPGDRANPLRQRGDPSDRGVVRGAHQGGRLEFHGDRRQGRLPVGTADDLHRPGRHDGQ